MKSILGNTLKASALCSMLFLYQLQAETIEVQVTNGMDDIEEHQIKHDIQGYVSTGSSDLEMTMEHDQQIVGIRFQGLVIPQGATITNAYIQFGVDEVSTVATNLQITAEDNVNAPAFTKTPYYLSDLQTLDNSIQWNPPAWNQVGVQGINQQTSDIKSLVQSIVNKTGWKSGNAMAFLISGTGKRVAESYDGDPSLSPILHVEYTTTDNGTQTPPLTMTEAIVADYRMDSCTFDGNSGDTKDATGHYNATSKN
ncbi:MAG: hypothetical protein DSZ05_06795, partial [Sulfurospirillum sp.]